MTPLLVGIATSLTMAQDVSPKAGSAGAARCKASQLIGCAITNTKNENLGEIQDIVLDSGNHRIAYAVVSYGGFLGMGEKYFAMPWRLIEVSLPGQDAAPKATLGLDQATLKNSPGFDKAKWPDMANPAWSEQVDTYYRTRGEKAPTEGTPPPKGSGQDGKSGVDRAPASKAFVHRRLGNLIGMNVVDLQQRKIAAVEDLIVETKLATVDGAVLSFGGTLGMNERLVLVAASVLSLDHEQNAFVFACTTARLEAMALPDGKLPPLNNDEWLTRCRDEAAKAKAAGIATDGDVIIAPASGRKPTPFADAYKVGTTETVKGVITTTGSVRIGDQNEERVRLRVRTAEGREVIVHAAPASWQEQQALGLNKGKTIEVLGSPIEYGTQTVLVAGAITVDGKSLKYRDDRGHAVWSKQ